MWDPYSLVPRSPTLLLGSLGTRLGCKDSVARHAFADEVCEISVGNKGPAGGGGRRGFIYPGEIRRGQTVLAWI